jgi:hypothetical protein
MDEIAEQVEEREMPLPSYTWIHTGTKLSAQQQQLLIDWAKRSRAALADTTGN